jgi:hypothetical protein
MFKYQYELNIDIYLTSRLFTTPYRTLNGDGFGESHGGSFCRVCDDLLAVAEPAVEPVAFAEPAVEPAVAFAEETE